MKSRQWVVILLLLGGIFKQIPVSGQQGFVAGTDERIATTTTNVVSLKSAKLASGINLEYAESGSAKGIPIIFLHGYTDSWHSFDQVMPLLPESMHAFFISQRGHGGSDRPKTGYSPDHFAMDVAQFIEALKIGPAIIVGHSMGATVAQRFGLDYPYLTKALVLVGSFASFKSNAGIEELQGIVGKMGDPVDSGFVTEFQKSTLFKPVPAENFRTYVSESMKVPARVWQSIAKETLSVDYTSELNNLSMPVLIVWGDKDIFCPRADQDILVSQIKRSTLSIHKGVGHSVQWEDPSAFTQDFLKFINANVK